MGKGKKLVFSRRGTPGDMPVMKAKCRTCPFRAGGDDRTRQRVTKTVLSKASQECHSSGWPVGTHLCRGARDLQLEFFHRLGVIDEPTDEAWKKAWEEMKNRNL